jgi:hypothetical protein
MTILNLISSIFITRKPLKGTHRVLVTVPTALSIELSSTHIFPGWWIGDELLMGVVRL